VCEYHNSNALLLIFQEFTIDVLSIGKNGRHGIPGVQGKKRYINWLSLPVKTQGERGREKKKM